MYFLNINKPKGLSSFDVIRKLRKRLGIKQIGHSGTLDPLASGVLQVAVGSATRLLDYVKSDKTYIADFRLGYTTNTFDSEGELVFQKTPDVSKECLIDVLKSFLGKSSQIPPVYSAIKIDGKKLCDIARKNSESEIVIPPREIEIYSIKLLEFDDFDRAKIEVTCKKGTYIRSLINDIGKKLGCGAYMTDLIRTKAGVFFIENSNNLEDDEYLKINPLDAVNLPSVEIDDSEYKRILNGNFIYNKTELNDCKILLIHNKILVSVAEISDNYIRPKKNFKGN